ncbi:Re/Si-specific NAD(P)(+) transhydrogenase subunit alpha [Mycobacteroides abscessus subsp. abscessus]|jgi:NAD(P) transhydrogenase subunit alpha|uniref:NAD(P) transhydrogenase subunit alpha n=1 Tax=Mycolicibacterium fortuitum TaxID=1766 RepID=A0ABD6QFG3_MYCFO|nr:MULTISPECIES: Re/Si-specific NAD(P)(+) transhydrogenase subunit alpha [Mycolicibacterium]MDO3239421.1 Re/Si-specific NAD(P)(+) transhydrogenase subunit alpha [Mycobacteroides abscessus subsp. abscessus]MCA4756224.1 Re/Si-specific NAD(P)(+) transhydrogenase subunit alpha [Mycolicibacterium fortuitum]NOP98364.1 Re/Si-specific NAD(P)(+) transhydrogenase subunit alpha [Mycolicibacterium fortuitum]OBA91008.1 NAD(P) transhydrogenase subunit alpha [Mycolicibacterium fortuitum]OBB09340.1 NAD(P) tra
MLIGIPRESLPGETRVAATPQTVGQIIKLGYAVVVESGAGAASSFSDAAYVDAGAEIGDAWDADVVLKVNAPDDAEIGKLRDGATLVSLISPALKPELVEKLSSRPITVLAMDAVPRISRAQSLDVLSSMANIAGYRAVVEAAHSFGRFFTGQVTAAGKVPPAKVLVVGAGVAGLAAIGAAGSLGAVVKATDPRPEVADQVASLGGEYVSVDPNAGEVSATGYAKEMGDDYKAREAELYAELAKDVDIIITTALIPGKPAPRIITAEMVASMKPGSVIVDMAAANGGNVEGTVKDQAIVTDNGVTIIGYTDLAGRLPAQASQLYGTNLVNLLKLLTPEKDGKVVLDWDDVVQRSMTVVRDGETTWPPPPVQVSAAPAAQPAAAAPAVKEEKQPMSTGRRLGITFAAAAAIFALIAISPAALQVHLTVFALAIVIGYYVIGNVHHALHTPLMSVTNAISGIIVVGALLQVGHGNALVTAIATCAILLASINVFGGFAVTRRMLAMFSRS